MGSLLGIDVGTESLRVGAYLPDGTLVATATASYRTTMPRPGWAEQDPDEWWRALQVAVREVAGAPAVGRIEGIGVSTTSSTVVVLDADGRPLRPAILWMDSRAADEAERTARSGHPALRLCGGSAAAEWTVPKAMWLARHEPEIYAGAHRIVEASDYLNWRLTGVWVLSRLNAVCKLHYDPGAAGFPEDLFSSLGVGDLVDRWPTTVVPVGGRVGELTRVAADELGIQPGAVVAQGGIDAHLAMVGSGVVDVGDVALIAGTSAVHLTHVEQPREHAGLWGPYPEPIMDGAWLLEGGQVSAGSILRWTSRLVGRSDPDAHAQLIEEATQVPAGSDGILVLDFWQGNRTPYRDARLRGTIFGLSLAHGDAQLYRAAVEGVAYGTANVIAAFAEAGAVTRRLVVSGGIRKHPLWLAATADVLQLPLEVSSAENPTTLAGALLASIAVGHHRDLPDAVRTLRTSVTVVEPDPQVAAVHQEGLERYRLAAEELRGPLRAVTPTLPDTGSVVG